MTEFIHFLGKHWVVSTSFLIAAVLSTLNEIGLQRSLKSQLNTQDVVRLMNQNAALLIDIRSSEHFQAGHIIGAINIPKNTTKDAQAVFGDKIHALLNQYKDKPIIMIDDTGKSSAKLIAQVKQLGFTEVYFLAKGILAWQTDHLPLVKK